MPDAIDKFIVGISEEIEVRLRDSASRCVEYTDSPIEALLLAAVLSMSSIESFEVEIDHPINRHWRAVEQLPEPQQQTIWVCPQWVVGQYRIDFMCLMTYQGAGKKWRLAVECDGHDYHERTKEQASNDRARDRFLQDEGFTVYRFTGADLHRDLYGCAKQIFRWAYDRIMDNEYPNGDRPDRRNG